ncbi:uncharacterized protein VICG_01211 [Vittaforma corneae ATCC 50505]|uniref:Uncharacterized protein n=1 Tax=Vittaforma corneae (strain ATCC 50505) TaxID=993615 RepID=L2GN27_VITCO|nr:uncharacterized protein VICG_01211 [Vittaforma corneae ATCC 50505]ELA41707.1 hypothetical protein VICG_01211 [Vittaforma corneae ATCC 50505]
MHGLSLSSRTALSLMRVLSIGFPMLFPINVGCTSTHECDVKKPEVQDKDSSKDVAENGQSNTQKKDEDSSKSSDSETLKVFKDDNGFLTKLMGYPEVSEVFNEYFEKIKLTRLDEYQAHRDEIWEVVVMHLCNCNPEIEDEVLKRGDAAVIKGKMQELMMGSSISLLEEIKLDGVRFKTTPVEVFKFFNDYCRTKILSLSGTTNVNVDVLNSVNLDKIKTVKLCYNGLTSLPCLSNFTNLQRLDLEGNNIETLEAKNYYDQERNDFKTMPKLADLKLHKNPIGCVNSNVLQVFTDSSAIIHLSNVVIFCTYDSMKKKLKGSGIKFIDSSTGQEVKQSEVSN